MISFDNIIDKQDFGIKLELRINLSSVGTIEMAEDLMMFHKIDMISLMKKDLLTEALMEIETELKRLC